MCFVKDCPRRRRGLVPTGFTLVLVALGQVVKLLVPALGAGEPIRPTETEQVFPTRIFVFEPFLEL